MQNLIPLPRSLPMSVNAIDARERARLTFHVDVVMLCECVIGDVRGRAPEDSEGFVRTLPWHQPLGGGSRATTPYPLTQKEALERAAMESSKWLAFKMAGANSML